ncbi:MAG: ATP-dependent sacrificial sulfur transferase LarE [Planctomycetaceae bacterium]
MKSVILIHLRSPSFILFLSADLLAMLSPELKRLHDQLLEIIAGYGRVAVAYSGGVDSVVVAKAAQLACGEKAVAVTAVSPSLASGELEEAQQIAQLIGIRHEILHTEEFENPDYLKNAPDRCYFCKTELYTQMGEWKSRFDIDEILNGANLDDRGDYRPGMQAASEHAVKSPLMEAGFRKSDVRELARFWDLPVWDKPATPCLSSRIAYGVSVTKERLERVDRAERFLRETLGVRELRVRHEANDLARIELPVDEIAKLIQNETRQTISEYLHSLGFKYVTFDLDGFRSGSLNAVVPLQLSLEKS